MTSSHNARGAQATRLRDGRGVTALTVTSSSERRDWAAGTCVPYGIRGDGETCVTAGRGQAQTQCARGSQGELCPVERP